MASTRPNAICISGKKHIRERKAATGTTIKPGQVLEVNAGEFREHATANGAMVPLIADLNPAHDIADGAAIDADYPVGDTVTAIEPLSGTELQVRMANAVSLVDGVTRLACDGSGRLTSVATMDATVIATAVQFVAAETKTTAAADELALVRRI